MKFAHSSGELNNTLTRIDEDFCASYPDFEFKCTNISNILFRSLSHIYLSELMTVQTFIDQNTVNKFQTEV